MTNTPTPLGFTNKMLKFSFYCQSTRNCQAGRTAKCVKGVVKIYGTWVQNIANGNGSVHRIAN